MQPKSQLRILLLEGVHDSAVELFAAQGFERVERLAGALSGAELARRLDGVALLGIRSRARVDGEALSANPGLLAIGAFCIGTNQIDLAAAAGLGIAAFNAPFSNTRSVAELVVAEAVLLLRGVPRASALLSRGVWEKSAKGAREARGKTLAVVGYGRIGAQVGALAEQFGMSVVFYDPEPKLALGNARQVGSLIEALAAADVVTLHVPETSSTFGLIGEAELAAMRPGAALINASRGGVVDVPALARALESGRLAGAAVDVFPSEPEANGGRLDSPLVGMDQALLTPHIGGSTEEAQENIGREVAAKLARFALDGSTVGAVNFPELALPERAGACRLLHVHRNEPGAIARVNQAVSAAGINVEAQYLRTSESLGYAALDLSLAPSAGVLEELGSAPGAIRCRLLA